MIRLPQLAICLVLLLPTAVHAQERGSVSSSTIGTLARSTATQKPDADYTAPWILMEFRD